MSRTKVQAELFNRNAAKTMPICMNRTKVRADCENIRTAI